MGGSPSHRLAFLSYFHLGCAGLFPWSALITAADFWESQFPGKHMDRLLTVAYLPTNLAVLAVLIWHHTRLSPHMRIMGGFAGYTVIMLAVPLQAKLLPPSNMVLGALLLLVALAGACDALAQGALYGEAAGLPTSIFTCALTSGASLAGVAVALLRLVTKFTLPDTAEGLRAGVTLYFLLAAAICLLAALVYGGILPRLAAMRYYRQAAVDAAIANGVDFVAEPGGNGHLNLVPDPGGSFLSTAGKTAAHTTSTAGYMELARTPPRTPPRTPLPSSPTHGSALAALHHRHHHSQLESWLGGLQEAPIAAIRPPPLALARSPGQPQPTTYGNVLNRMWKVAASLVFTYAVTLTIFPGVLAEDEHSKRLGSWYPELLIAAYAVAEWVGKNVPILRCLRVQWGSSLLCMAIARAAFVPAFRLAAEHHAGPPVVGGLTFALGFSNGWLTACAMMMAPTGLHGTAAGMAGTIAVFALVLGLNCGALLSFAWLL